MNPQDGPARIGTVGRRFLDSGTTNSAPMIAATAMRTFH